MEWTPSTPMTLFHHERGWNGRQPLQWQCSIMKGDGIEAMAAFLADVGEQIVAFFSLPFLPMWDYEANAFLANV